MASAGGVWTALVCGFGGMRDHYGELSFDPRLPESWPELSYTLRWHDAHLNVTLTREALTLSLDEGEAEPVAFSVRGREYVIAPGEEISVELADQGPVRSGRPTIEQFEDIRREDGTLLSASVPTVTTVIPALTGPIPVGNAGGLGTGDDSDLGADS